jgi:tryptophanyl-tRNA synthetase
VDSIGDGELKTLLVTVLEELIAPIRERREYYKKNPAMVANAIESGSKRAREE